MTLFVLFLGFFLLNTDDWNKVADRSGIKVYTRLSPDSQFKEVKVDMKINASLNEITAALEDIPTQKQWVLNTIDAFVVNKINAGEFYYYLSTRMPFPISNRDAVIHYTRSYDPVREEVTTISLAYPNYYKSVENYIRIPYFHSSYTITKLDDHTCQVKYKVLIDPGGTLPAWIVNLAISRGPYESMYEFRELVQSGQYKSSKVSLQ